MTDDNARIHTEEWLDLRIRGCEEQIGSLIAQRDNCIGRIRVLEEYLEGYKEARAIFLTYRVNSEVRVRLKRVGLERLEPNTQ